MSITAAPALAERTYDSQITGLTNPVGAAFDSGDNFWVSQPEAGGGAIFKYDPYPSQTKLAEQTGEGHYGATYIQSIAVDSFNGFLYVADSGPESIDVFNTAEPSGQKFVEQWSVGGGYDHVAIDNSGGASNGRVYVSKASEGVVAFDAGHNPVNFSASASYISGDEITGTPSGNFGRAWNLAVDAEGNIYVVDEHKNVVDEFESSGRFIRAFTGAGGAGEPSFSDVTGVAVDPTNRNVLVVDSGSDVIDEFSSSGEFLSHLTGPLPESFGSLQGGIAVNSSGYLYVPDSANNVVDIFTPSAILPKVSYGSVTNQTQTSGVLGASIDLNGGPEVTSCAFQYGTTTEYGHSVPCSPGAPYSTSPTSVTAELTGLTTETTYHYRVVLVTANGTERASDQTFIPHAVAGLTTEPATNVDRNEATLNGSFTGNGEDVRYFFEWGTSTAYGHTTSAPPGSLITAPSGAQSESFLLSGLQAETTYHYRIVASDAAGTSVGSDQSFQTLPALDALSTEAATSISASTAFLNASFIGISEEVHYFFEWGPTNAYGHTTPIETLNSPVGMQSVSEELGDLDPNSKYHYRVVASDATGTSFGADRSLTTLGRYAFSSSIGEAGAGDGELSNPQDVAVDNSSGSIYVADTGNHRIVKFASNGDFVAAWGWGVADGKAESEVCTGGCQVGIPGSGSGQFGTPRFVEVDNSKGPSQGDVYVADTNDEVVQKFDSSGKLLTEWGNAGAESFNHGTIGGLTVDNSGNLFVLSDEPRYLWTEFSQDGTLQSQTPTDGSYGVLDLSFGAPAGTGIDISSTGAWYELTSGGVSYSSPSAAGYATEQLYGAEVPVGEDSGIVIDRSGTGVFVDQGSYIDQFEPPTRCGNPASEEHGCDPTDTFGAGSLQSAAGLALDPSSGSLLAADGGNDNIAVFTPLPVPEVETGAATAVGSTSGTLTGHLDPGGSGTISSCYFEYGTDATYSLGTVPCSHATPITSASDVTAQVGGLQPFVTYHYRLVAIRSDGNGFPGYGRDQTFTTSTGEPPTVASAVASDVAPTSATITTEINPNSAPTLYRIQYGSDMSYGSQTPPSESIGEDGVNHLVSSALSGLSPGTTYHFRVLAINFNGLTVGTDRTFSTPNIPEISNSVASIIAHSTATLSAEVKPGFSPTTYHFEYGQTGAYGASTPESGSIGSDNADHPASVTLTGLAAGASYHFRLVATNAIGTTDGPDQTFSTESAELNMPPQGQKCKAGFVRKHGRCVKRRGHRMSHRHRRRSQGRG